MEKLQLENELYVNYTPEAAVEKAVDLLNAVGQSIPGISLLVSYKNNRDFRMMANLLVELKKQVDDFIEKEKVYERLRTEEGEALLNYGLLKSQDCHRKEQVSKMVDIIMAALAKEVIDNKDAEVLIDIVSDLNIKEAEFFLNIYNCIDRMNKEFPARMSSDYCWKIEGGIDYNNFIQQADGLIRRLEGKGLLESFDEYEGLNTFGPPSKKRVCNLTYSGICFVRVIYGCKY